MSQIQFVQFKGGPIAGSRRTFGAEGRELQEIVKAAQIHWAEPRNLQQSTAADQDQPYSSVPPLRTFSVRARYVNTGRGTPLPFDLED